MSAFFASELEFYVFDETFESASDKRWRELKTMGNYIEDYHILQTTKNEPLLRAIRNGLMAAGIPVENSKGEWGPGQEEVNVRYAEALTMADWHVVMKNGIKEIAHLQNRSVTFMAKWALRPRPGSSSHIHSSLWDQKAKKPLFMDQNDPLGMSATMKSWLAGHLTLAPDFTYFLAPYINSYKRFQVGTFAPDQGRLVGRQPHRRLPRRRGGQVGAHRMPHRRRRSQSLSRLLRLDRRRPPRHGREAGAGADLLRRRLWRVRASAKCRRPCATPFRRSTARP